MNRLTTFKPIFIALFLIAGFGLTSCNKDVPAPSAIITLNPTGNTIGDIVNTDANFSYLKAAVTRAGLLAALQNRDARFTVFAPDNAAFNRLFAALVHCLWLHLPEFCNIMWCLDKLFPAL
jgi:hypothetical protein